MAELLVAIILTCIVAMVLNSKFVNSPKMDKIFTKIANKFF